MTTPNVTGALAVPSLEDAIAAVRASGLRLSSARRLVLEALFRARRPVTAEQIAGGLGGIPASDIASVYRNLETLERLGVVRHVHLGHGPGLYALASEGRVDYLVCEACGRTEVIDSAELEGVRAEIRERFDFEPRFSHFPLFGLCADCALTEAKAEATDRGGAG